MTLDQVNAEFIALARRLAEDNPKTNQNFTSASVQPLLKAFTGVQLRQQVWAMLAAVILVLLIACVNVMNMQFGRAALRSKELAIRGALGATRWRLVRQMLTESPWWSLCLEQSPEFSWPIGRSICFLARSMLLPFPPPYWWRFTIDARVLVFTLGATLCSDHRFRFGSRIPELARKCRGNDERRWPRQQQSLGQRHNSRPCGRTNCVDCGLVDRGDVANQIDPKSNEARLWLRRNV